MLTPLLKDPQLQIFLKEMQKKPALLVEELWETPKAILTLMMQKALDRHVLILSGKRESKLLDAISFFGGQEPLDFLPLELLPGEEAPSNLDISGSRVETLYKLLEKGSSPLVIHCSIQSLMQKLPKPSSLKSLCMELRAGKLVSFSCLPELLTQLGYVRVSLTAEKGEFSVRGGLIDLFPSAADQPYRIDFFGEEIESIRTFDPLSQKSNQKVESLFLCPTSEWELLKQEKKPATLLDYLSSKTTAVFLDDPLAIEDSYIRAKTLSTTQDKYTFDLKDILSDLSSYPLLFSLSQPAEELSPIEIHKPRGRAFHTKKDPFQPLMFSMGSKEFSVERWNHPFLELAHVFSRGENSSYSPDELLQGLTSYADSQMDLHFVVDSLSEETMIRNKLETLHISLPQKLSFDRGYLPSGFVLESSLLTYLPTAELTHRYKIRRKKWRVAPHAMSSDFHELNPGDPVVHLHHGIGTFLGTDKQINHLGQETEFLQIEYAKNSKLYVPVSQSHLVNRYIGAKEEKPVLNILGTNKWQKTYQQAQQSIVGYAKELLDQMAKREVSGGFVFPEDSLLMQMFEEGFPFPETEDQLKAIAEIKQDMTSSEAMDRLLCGDVGYGKTEVAMRAAFKAVCDGNKQVIILVPTTVLAMQHFETFSERMADFPVRIGLLTRFSSPKECRELLQRMKKGDLDILVGTHRAAQKNLVCKDLGLLIIDEEQRFGVRVKEFIKKQKVGVECLTLSATPIPRTLYLSLIGIRSISEINTPPQDRLPIKSLLIEKDSSVIKNALLREFSRDGQAFFIHNRVETLPLIRSELQKLVPEARIAIAHGQMDSEEIDTVFQSFKQGEIDLLISTTLIENGIDIPNANTILIDRADSFGMADLYQLRGRVGRWNRPAYAYFLLPSKTTLSEIARKRLQTLIDNSGYGSGLKIALRDLEIRGAGDILGEQQSGQVSAIGFHLYCKLLKKAIEALKKQTPLQFFETKLEFPKEAKIPEEFIAEPALRMEIYYRLGNTSSPSEVDEILSEIQDRFGVAPYPVLLLTLFTRIRIQASSLQISLLQWNQKTLYAEKIVGSVTYKTTFSLPKLGKNLRLFEEEVLLLLKEWKIKKQPALG